MTVALIQGVVEVLVAGEGEVVAEEGETEFLSM